MASKLITINRDNTVAVNQTIYWIPIDSNTPIGVKLLLINRKLGVATTGHYYPGNDWTHWQGMPKFLDEDHDESS